MLHPRSRPSRWQQGRTPPARGAAVGSACRCTGGKLWRALYMARTAALPILTAENGLTRYLEEIRRVPMLEPQDEFIFDKRLREQGDRYAAHKLVTSHMSLVAKIAIC